MLCGCCVPGRRGAERADCERAGRRRHPHHGHRHEQTIDCNNATLFVNGSWNVITTTGVCYAVTMQGSGNTVIADTVTDDITVYGYNQTVMFHNGDPYILDRGRELGMTNRIDRVPA